MAENNENNTQNETPGTERVEERNETKESRPKAFMVPLLSKRSIVTLAIGLIFGIGLGFIYWAISPSINAAVERFSAGQPVGTDFRAGPHQSTVSIEITNPGSSYMSLTDLRRMGEYYSSRANTYSFFTFLSEKLESEEPQYSHTADELEELTSIRYDWNAEHPAIEVIAIGSSNAEALFLARFIPEVFQDYLIEEEKKIKQKEYDDIVHEMEIVRLTLLEAEKQLMEYPIPLLELENDANYLALRSKVAALEDELDDWTGQLAILIALDIDQEDTDYAIATSAVERISIALAEVNKELSNLEAAATTEFLPEELEYERAQTKVEDLKEGLDELADMLSLAASENGNEPEIISYMVIGEPSPVIPFEPGRIRGRNAAMMGAVFGLGIAWIALNRKWLTQQLSSSPETIEEGEEEEA